MRLDRVRAPSSNLLRFLRDQNNGVPFFSANPIGRQSAGRQIQHHHSTRSAARSSIAASTRSMTTCARTSGTIVPLEASLFTLKPFSSLRNQPKTDGFLSNTGEISFFDPSQVLTPVSVRHASSSQVRKSEEQDWHAERELKRREKYLQKLFKHLPGGSNNSVKNGSGLQPNDLPPLTSFLDDSSSLGRSVRAPNELRIRCTEFDESGNITLVNSEFKKSELIAKYGLMPRDLRKIDSSLLPSILVRPSAILINLLHLRVLIKHDRVLVFDTYGTTDSYTQSLFLTDLESKLRTPETRTPGSSTVGGALPYEFRALEAVLISVTSGLEGEFIGVREPVVAVLRELEEDIDRDKLRHLLIYSKKLSSFEQKARLVRDAIDDLLEADDDLAAMYLTEKARGVARAEDSHNEIEMLLESYANVSSEIVQLSSNIVNNIHSTEEIVKAILDANRNSLMLLDLKFSIGTLGLGGGTFVAALYGMNLKNFIEESDLGFWGVSAWCSVVSVIVCIWGLKKLRGVQRVRMWGQMGYDRIKGRQGWNQVDGGYTDQLQGQARRERLLKAQERGKAGAPAIAGANGGAAASSRASHASDVQHSAERRMREVMKERAREDMANVDKRRTLTIEDD